jgi:homoserine dehydrogenase
LQYPSRPLPAAWRSFFTNHEDNMKSIKVGLLGIGTVGSGTFNVLQRNQQEIARRAGRGIEITMVAARNTARATELTQGQVKVVNDGNVVVNYP